MDALCDGTICTFLLDPSHGYKGTISKLLNFDQPLSVCAAEDREFTSRINKLRVELTVACQKRIYFVQELEIVKSVIAPVTMAEFLNEIQFKDDQRLMQFQNLERETEARAFEKELFVKKL
nr:hypothetical protein [Tanacetum cinerariifolium]